MGSIYSTIRNYPEAENQKQLQPNSPFDRLPDDVIRIIINKIHDARILVRLLTLNKRFASIVPQTDAVTFPLYVAPRPGYNTNNNNNNNNSIINDNSNTNLARGNPLNILRSVVDYIITTFLRRNNRRNNRRDNLRRRRRCRPESGCIMTGSLCQNPPQILRTFRNITDLNLKLHTVGGAVDNVFLKWKASYNGELKTCVVICATSFRRFAMGESQPAESDPEPPPPSVPNDEFKSRVMWTISCLIASSARHYLVKQVLEQFPNVKKVRVTDARRQGKLCLVDDEIQELRESLKEEGAMELTADRIVPDLRLRMWYVPVLDLQETRCEMKGATLLVIGPANSKGELVPPPEMYGVDGGFDGNAATKKVFAEAEREIVNIKKRNSYVMELTSF